MALGKLWQVFFGKRSESDAPVEADRVHPTSPPSPNALRPIAGSPPGGAPTQPASVLSVVTKSDAAPPKRSSGLGRAKLSLVNRSIGAAVAPQVVPADAPAAAAAHDSKPACPKKNSWTPWLAGRTVLSVLDTQPGDGTRAVEVLEALVCVSNPVPKYAAIGAFELASGGVGGLSVLKFHRMIRAAGGQAIPIPGGLIDGLRHLSRTHGTVDLILLDGPEADWERLETRRWIERVAHRETTILRRAAEGRWVTIERTHAVIEKRPSKVA